MERRLILFSPLLMILLLAACRGEEPVDSGKTYPIRGTIVARNERRNLITTDHEEIPGFMEAMRMTYEVRGQKVGSLPPDGSRFEARVHVTGDGYWLTDLRPLPSAP